MPDTDEVCTGMDVPVDVWGPDDVAFWTGTERYQPWKDVAAFFKVRSGQAMPHDQPDR